MDIKLISLVNSQSSRLKVRLMYDNLQIAHQEGNWGSYELVLEDNINPNLIPFDVFPRGITRVPLSTLTSFIAYRLYLRPDDERESYFKRKGITELDLWVKAMETKVCTVNDGWWLSFHESDSFIEDTIRGKMGYKEL